MMNNPFKVSDEKLTKLITGYDEWLKSDKKEESYPEEFRRKSKKIKEDFLNIDTLSQMSDDDLFTKIFKYSKQLEGPAHINLGEARIKTELNNIRLTLNYILTSDDSPFEIAQEILEGKYKMLHFSKAFWSPILQTQFPDELPNWNNKTEDFLKKFGINISSASLSVADKYKRLSEAFKILSGLKDGNDFYHINHLMHYGTVIPEGIKLIEELTGIQAADPVLVLIKKYKDQIRENHLKNELYKWELLKKYKGRPDLTASDFASEIKSIEYNNLVYPMTLAVRKRILDNYPQEYQACFVKLFNDADDITQRVKNFMNDVQDVYKKSKGEKAHHHDERTISTFLTFHNPDKYTFFKDSFYTAYCKMKGIKPKPKGEKYTHYMELVNDFRDQYVLPDAELLSLFNEFMNTDCFEDEQHLVKVQDILYQMLDKGNDEPNDIETENENNESDKSHGMKKYPLNTILYGPPGTGKTYSTISRAVAIIENEKKLEDVEAEAETNFTNLKGRYDDYVNEGKIVFTTFHQSMAYEDFIEGIKPKMPDSEYDVEDDTVIDGLNYGIEEGIFKQLCFEARKNEIQELDFDQLWASFANEILNSKEEVVFTSVSSEIKLEKELSTPNSLKIRYKKSWDINESQGTKIFQVGKEPMRKLFDARIDVSDPKVSKLGDVKNILSPGSSTSYYAVYKSFFQHAHLGELFNKKDGLTPHVLIIDEINRGNISQIFGELITLIEDDKREGEKTELSATLPYSKEKFSIPSNVYIIGTMNTADRSVEALDTALRRRFSFVPKMPKPERLSTDCKGINLQALLETINNRLIILKDNDHTIGHAWLMGITDFGGLKKVFEEKILPLLQEYFYNDYEKLGLVLGEGFFNKPVTVNRESFAAFKQADELASRYYDITKLTLKDPESWKEDDFLKIYVK